jgi:U2 small nuclear ribonucleoprotein B''
MFAELRRTLYGLFSQFGGILDVVALKTPKMRGQAFIVFKVRMGGREAARAQQQQPAASHARENAQNVGCASNALRSMQDFPLFGKNMVGV